MQATMKRWQVSTVVLVAMGAAGSCGGAGSDAMLPAGWTGARTLTAQQSACNGNIMSAAPGLEISVSGSAIAATYKDAEFRCTQQVCAYVLDSGPTARGLFQPCDLHPSSVPRCDCLYDLSFTLPSRPDREAVEIYRRVDFYGATSPPLPQLVATQSLVAP